MEYRYDYGGETIVVQVEISRDAFALTVAGRAYQVKAGLARPAELDLVIDGQRRCLAYVAAEGASRWVALPSGQVFQLTVPGASRRSGHARASGHESLEAQMPGIVRRVLVAEGEAVSRGQALVLLEAMKMEIRVTAPHAGVVERMAVAAGQTVERGQPLVELSSPPDPPAGSSTPRS